MILGKPHPYHDRQGSRAQCRSPRIPANGNTPSPSHSSNEFPQNDPSGFMNGSSDTMDDVSISPNDALSEANDLSSRPSRKIKPKQFDANFVDSGSVLQVLRQQTWQELADLNVEVEANILAGIDEDAYREALLCDADRILHQYLLPMAFPWSEEHVFSDVVKVFPRDIDEMPDILRMSESLREPFENGLFGYGKFEIGKSLKALSMAENYYGKRAATRRTEDPGVIELTIIDIDDETEKSPFVASMDRSAGFSDAGLSRSNVQRRRSTRKRKSSSIESLETPVKTTRLLSEYFTRYQEMKRAKTEHASKSMQKMLVSVRFGGVSSRKSVLDADIHPWIPGKATVQATETENANKAAPILVKVQLPLEVQTGRFLVYPNAEENGKRLGSYDMRYGMPSLDLTQKSGNRMKRIVTGRTRLMWTKAHIGGNFSGESSSSRTRIAYSTILTSDRVDVALCKRPREVVLAVRVNGARLAQKRNESISLKAIMDRPFGDDNESVAVASGLTTKSIAEAVLSACGPVLSNKIKKKQSIVPLEQPASDIFVRGEPICILQTEKFVHGLIASARSEMSLRKRSSKSEVASTGTGIDDEAAPDMPDLIPPKIECLPTLDGLLRVVCVRVGRMQPKWVPDILAFKTNDIIEPMCTVCFVRDGSESIKVCNDCGVTVHASCYLSKGLRLHAGTKWHCSICSELARESSVAHQSWKSRKRKPKTPSRFRDAGECECTESSLVKGSAESLKCQLCPHSGGAMSPSTRNDGYVHEVCRIWTNFNAQTHFQRKDDIKDNPLLNRIWSRCAICGICMTNGTRNELVRCAASACQVKFHPMCALLTSKMASAEANKHELPSEEFERMSMEDQRLCSQYTLTKTICTVAEKDKSISKVLPVAFCGFHNPRRDPSLFGCHPCGGIIGDFMRIPS